MTLGKVDEFRTVKTLSLRQSQYIIELGNESLDGRNELNDTLRDDYCSKIVAILSTLCHSRSNVFHNIVERHVLLLYFLRDKADIWLSLKCALKSDVRSRTTHHLDEMPVLTSRVAVTLDIADKL